MTLRQHSLILTVKSVQIQVLWLCLPIHLQGVTFVLVGTGHRRREAETKQAMDTATCNHDPRAE